MIRAPKDIFGPNAFRIFLEELGRERVCKMLDIHENTLRRWLRGTSPVPRMAVLALYWETSYGRSLIESDQVNGIRRLARRVDILLEQYLRAKDVVAGLRRLHTGTANEPYFEEFGDLYANEAVQTQYGTAPTRQHSETAPVHSENLQTGQQASSQAHTPAATTAHGALVRQ